MPVYELDFNDFSSNEYALLAIHTPLSDYKLAYLLNKELNHAFKRCDFELDKKDKYDVKASFSVYEYDGAEYFFYLISNSFKNRKITSDVGLFSESYTVDYLVPEKKKVDFFIKIEGEVEEPFLNALVGKLKGLPQVLTSYEVEVESLKSKDFLIF